MATTATKSVAVNGSNVAILDQSCKVGTVRYYQKNGRTYLRTTANKVGSNYNPRTDKQMRTRLLHNSALTMWKKVGKYLKGAFEYKTREQSDYNAFMQENAGLGVFFTKREFYDHCALPVENMVCARGSLLEQQLEMTPNNKWMASSIDMLSGTDISTVGKLSRALIEQNSFENGDVLLVLRFLADDMGHTGVIHHKFIVDEDSTSPQTFFSTDGDDKLKFPGSTREAACIIWAKPDGRVSTSLTYLSDELNELVDTFSTDEKFQLARDSYGKVQTSFLK